MGNPDSKITAKRCSTCKLIKPITEFHKRSELESGLTSKCKVCRAEHVANTRDSINTTVTRRRNDYRNQILEKLGGKCSCCSETTTVFLTIDHINGGGNAERMKVGKSRYYKYIVMQGIPPDKYRILCYNCNAAYMILGYCPHSIAEAKS